MWFFCFKACAYVLVYVKCLVAYRSFKIIDIDIGSLTEKKDHIKYTVVHNREYPLSCHQDILPEDMGLKVQTA